MPSRPAVGEGQRLRGDLVRPADAVLDLLRGVRLDEHLGEEEPHEVVVVALDPVVLVVLRPPVGGLQPLVPGEPVAVLVPNVEPARRRQGHDAGHPFRVAGCEVNRPRAPAGEPDDHGALGLSGVEDRQGVGRILRVGVGIGAVGAIRVAAAAAVERDDAVVAGQVGHLRLPGPRRDDRPGRQQQDRDRTAARDGVRQAYSVPVHDPGRRGDIPPGARTGSSVQSPRVCRVSTCGSRRWC